MTNAFEHRKIRALLGVLVVASALGLLAFRGYARANQPVASDESLPELRRLFHHPPDEARIMMRWWWFGPAVEKSELERELQAMKQGGIGGVEIQPVYPLAFDDPRHGFKNFSYLSDDFLDRLRFAAEGTRARTPRGPYPG